MTVMSSTPDNITELKPNEIFVFGSNLDGFHDGGAARVALEKFGAIYGSGDGMQGQTYAIPTLSRQMKPLSIRYMQTYTRKFIETAKEHPKLTFYLTKIGCGIAGFSEDEIKPLFTDTPKNIVKPKGW